jgi:hypothetical protein
MSLKTKINNNLRGIYLEYIKNHDSKKYLNDITGHHDDEDETIKDLDNISSGIETIGSKVYMALKQNGIDQAIFENTAAITKIKASAIRHTLEDIFEHETTMLKEEIIIILQLFLLDHKHTMNMIHSRYFHTWALNLYKVSNTNSTLIIRQKEILDIWIKQYGERYARFNRASSVLNFRKSIFIYIADNIIKYA